MSRLLALTAARFVSSQPYQSTLLSTLPGIVPCLPNGWLGVFSVLFRCFLQHGESGRYVPKDCLAAAPTELTAVRAETGSVLPGISGSPLHWCASVYVCVCARECMQSVK